MTRSEYRRLITYFAYLQKHYAIKPSKGRFVISLILKIIGRFASIIQEWRAVECVDILFLPSCDADKKRMAGVVDKLVNEQGLTVAAHIVTPKVMLKAGKFGNAPLLDNPYLMIKFGIASYLMATYRAKLIVMMDNHDVMATVFREQYGMRVVNIAHGVRTNHWTHSYIDYDYYLLFGKSSTIHLKQNPYLFGSTIPVLVGSPFVDAKLDNSCTREPHGAIVYFAQYLHPHVRDDLLFSHRIFLEFVKSNPHRSFIVKLHPLDYGGFWQSITAEMPNVSLYSDLGGMHNVMNKASLGVSAWSNTMVEATVYGCPIIAIDRTYFARQNLDLAEYFPVVDNVAEFAQAVMQIEGNYEYYCRMCEKFAEYHLSFIGSSQKRIADVLAKIRYGRLETSEYLKETHLW